MTQSFFQSNLSLTYLFKIPQSYDQEKLGLVMTFFTLFKGFVGPSVLYLPRQVQLGGWLTTILSLTVCLFLTYFCALRLLKAQEDCNAVSLEDIGRKAYGKVGKNTVGFFLVLSQSGFTIGYIYFISSQIQSIFEHVFGISTSFIVISLILYLILIPLQWLRDQSKLAHFHFLADIVIAFTVCVVMFYCGKQTHDFGWAKNTDAIKDTWVSMVGFSVFVYEGIGLGKSFVFLIQVLPVKILCSRPKSYYKIILSVLITIYILFCGYGLYTFFAFGSLLSTPLVLAQLPPQNFTVIVSKLLFCFNLIITFPLQLQPAVETIEDWLYSTKKLKTNKRQNYERIDRTIIIGVIILITILLGTKVELFLGFSGAFSCIPIAFTFPCLFHYRLSAKTKFDKIIDLSVVLLSVLISIFCTILCLKQI